MLTTSCPIVDKYVTYVDHRKIKTIIINDVGLFGFSRPAHVLTVNHVLHAFQMTGRPIYGVRSRSGRHAHAAIFRCQGAASPEVDTANVQSSL
jgi:hypothetical protein